MVATLISEITLEVVSKVPDEDHDASELEEAAVDSDKPLVANQQPSPVSQPCEEALHFPAFAIAAQRSAVLKRSSLSAPAVWTDQFTTEMSHEMSQPVRIIGTIHDQTAGEAARPLPAIRQGINGELHLRGRCGGKGASHRKTLAVRHHHPLCSFALLGLSDTEPPFLAGAKLPSMKHSCQSSWPCWSSWKMNARHRLSHTSFSSQFRSRRQQVLELGRYPGLSFQRAPVLRTHRIPSSTSRSALHGLPNELGSGKRGSIRSQTASVMNS